MKKLLSVLLIFLILLSNVSCDKEADPTVPPETSVTTEAPLPPVDPLLEEYAFVLTDDLWSSYDLILTRKDPGFDYLRYEENDMNPDFVSYSNTLSEYYSPGEPVLIGITGKLEKYSYCFTKHSRKDGEVFINYAAVISFDHTKSFVDVNDFEVKNLVKQPNENMSNCPDQQTGYYVLENAIYYYYEDGIFQFVRWACGGIQITIEFFADVEGYGFDVGRTTLFMKKSTTKAALQAVLQECGLPPLTEIT